MKKKRFSLIELLIVIAVIAILLTLIQPALTRAIGQAKRVLCLNQMRQHMNIQMTASDDNSGKYIDRIGQIWGNWLWDYTDYERNTILEYGGSREMFYCPLNLHQNKESAWNFIPGPNVACITGYGNTFHRRIEGRDFVLSKANQGHPSETETIVDVIISRNGQYAGIVGGWDFPHRSSHVLGDEDGGAYPSDSNIMYADGHGVNKDLLDLSIRYRRGGLVEFSF